MRHLEVKLVMNKIYINICKMAKKVFSLWATIFSSSCRLRKPWDIICRIK